MVEKSDDGNGGAVSDLEIGNDCPRCGMGYPLLKAGRAMNKYSSFYAMLYCSNCNFKGPAVIGPPAATTNEMIATIKKAYQAWNEIQPWKVIEI